MFVLAMQQGFVTMAIATKKTIGCRAIGVDRNKHFY
jgi:hypothetical protein